MRESGISAAICLAIWVGVVSGQAGAPATYQPGQQVEVREGDDWSSATIMKKEGRKYQIRYATAAEGSEEWVTTDRIRAAGAGGAAGAAPNAPAGATAIPAAPTKPKPVPLAVKIGDHVETKWALSWFKSIVKGKSPNGWVLIAYDGESGTEWVQPWRIRKIGSTIDVPSATPNSKIYKSEPAPKEPPEEMPQQAKSSGSEPDVAADPAAPVTDANVATAKEFVVTGSAGWTLVPDPAPAAKHVSAQPIVLKGGVGDIFDKVSEPIFAAQGNRAVVVLTNAFKKGQATLEQFDLNSGQSLGANEMPEIMACDVSDDGTMLLARSNLFGFGQSGRLDVWKIDSAKPQHVISFMPFGDKEGLRKDIKWARYTGPDRAVTCNSDGRLIAWDIKAAKAIWATDVEGISPALSGGRKQIAVVADATLAVLDSATGKTLASTSLERRPSFAMLSFRPDGKQIGLATDGVLRVWDAATGAPVIEASFDGSVPQSIDWPADGFVLLNGRTLIDLSQRITIWTYNGAKASAMFGGKFWYVAEPERRGGKMVLTSAVIPDDAVKRAAATIKPDEIWAAKAGTSVTLDAGGLPGDISGKAVTALRSKLEANGFKVADGQPIRLVASVEAGKPQEIHYRKFGESPFGGGTTINATPQTMKVAFIDADNKTLWQRQTTKAAPMMLSLKEGQTTEQAVAEATKPDSGLFENVTLPKFVPKAQYRNGLGTSNLTARGVSK